MNALYVICGLSFISLLAEIINWKKGLTLLIVGGLVVAGILVFSDWNSDLHFYNDMVVFNNLSLGFTALIVLVSIFWFWMSGDYFNGHAHQTDRSALILFTLTGAVLMVSFNNMAILFLGIEILSISLYVLAGSKKESFFSNEAAFKYFIMGSFATGFLLMGITLVYGATGSFHLEKINALLSTQLTGLPGFFYAGVILIMVGMGFKISAVPFHFWAPDVYEGSPVTITAFMSTVVKIAAVAAFYRIFAFTFSPVQSSWGLMLQGITIMSLIIPNVTAVYQDRVKRMLAYSSVGHIGYILLAFLAGGKDSYGTVFYYLTGYSLASIAAFSVLTVLEKSSGSATPDMKGLFKRNPFMAVTMTISLLSLAGIPPLAGFFGKYLVFAQGIDNGYAGIVILAVITSLVGVYYYFRVIISMFSAEVSSIPVEVSISTRIQMGLLIILILLLGIFPDQLISLFAI